MQIVDIIILGSVNLIGFAALIIMTEFRVKFYRDQYLKVGQELFELKDKLYSPQLEIQQNFESIAEKALHGVSPFTISSEGYGEECKDKPDAYSRVRNALFKAYAKATDKV